MKMLKSERNWVKYVRLGQLDEAYGLYISQKPSFTFFKNIALRIPSAWISYIFVFIIRRNALIKFEDDLVDLDEEFLIFWKCPNVMGRLLVVKGISYYIKFKVIPGRALAWYAHWLVFQGRYKNACIIFKYLLTKVPKGSRIHGELLSLVGNYFHARGKLEASVGYHTNANLILKANGDVFFQMFNLGTSAKTYAEIGNLELFNEKILASFDHLDPKEPDERYGMRVLIYSSYLNILFGNIDLGKQFYLSAERCYQKSGSPLDKSIYCIYKAVILLFFCDLDGARSAICDASTNLKRYGYYKSYDNLIRTIRAHLTTGGASHQIIRNLLSKDNGAMRSELESWYCNFFTMVLPALEGFQSQELSTIVEPLEKSSCSTIKILHLKDDLKAEDIKEAYFHVSDGHDGYTIFELDLFHQDKLFRLTLSTSYKKWRNPEIYEAIRSTLYLLQNISRQDQLKNITFSQSQRIKESEIARRIAHDIKSPLAALQVALSGLSSNVTDYSIIKSSTQRIEDITNSLTRKRDVEAIDKQDKILVKSFMDSLIASKRFEYQGKGIEINLTFHGDSSVKYINVNELELSRTLSNILNNAIESYSMTGSVNVTISSTNSNLIIAVQDYGCGIDPKHLDEIFHKDVSINKKGSGLGLYYAKKFTESSGGTVHAQSQLGQGSIMTLTYPLATPPSWIKTMIFVHDYERIVIVDDFVPNIELMEKKIRSQCPEKDILTFHDLNSFINFLGANDNGSTFFIIDYDFVNDSRNGLDVILEYKLTSRAVLATHHFESEDVVKKCIANAAKIIPKIVFDNIRVINECPNVFVVDDEKYFLQAVKSKLDKRFNVHIFESGDGLIEKAHQAVGPTFFFIDRNFNDSAVKGDSTISNLKDIGKSDLYNISEERGFLHKDAIKLRKQELTSFLE